MSRRVFYQGETVRSEDHGLAVVMASGEDPYVRFIGGWEIRVAGETLQRVPEQVYEAEVHNRALIEAYLTWRIYGDLPSSPDSLPRPELDLEAAIRQHDEQPPVPFEKPAPLDSAILYFD